MNAKRVTDALASSFRMSRGWRGATRQVAGAARAGLRDQWRAPGSASTEHAWWKRPRILASLRADHRTSRGGEGSLVSEIEKQTESLCQRTRRPRSAWLHRASCSEDDDERSAGRSFARASTSADLSHVRHACRTLASYRVGFPTSPTARNCSVASRPPRRRDHGAATVRAGVFVRCCFSLRDRARPPRCYELRAMASDHGGVGSSWEEGLGRDDAEETDPAKSTQLRTKRCLTSPLFSARASLPRHRHVSSGAVVSNVPPPGARPPRRTKGHECVSRDRAR